MAETIFATAATADAVDAGVGVVWWESQTSDGYALRVLDYDVLDVPSIDAAWLGTFFARSAALVDKHRPTTRGCLLRVEHPGLANILKRADAAYRDAGEEGADRWSYAIAPVRESEAAKWPATLDDRAFAIRPLVDSGKTIKLEMGLRRFSFRSLYINHLVAQIKRHRPGDSSTAGELLHAFVLGVLLGTAHRGTCSFGTPPKVAPASGPFGAYHAGRR